MGRPQKNGEWKISGFSDKKIRESLTLILNDTESEAGIDKEMLRELKQHKEQFI